MDIRLPCVSVFLCIYFKCWLCILADIVLRNNVFLLLLLAIVLYGAMYLLSGVRSFNSGAQNSAAGHAAPTTVDQTKAGPSVTYSTTSTTTVNQTEKTKGSGPYNVTKSVLVKHIILIVLENKNASYVLSGSNDPYIKHILLTNYSAAEDYYSIGHPSLLNYVALIAGSPFNIKNNSYPVDTLNASNLVDLLEEHNMSWQAYMESMPKSNTSVVCANGVTDSTSDPINGPGYVHKHDPFTYFQDILNNYGRCSKIVPMTQFYSDLQDNKLPQFSFITPNVTDDGHTAPSNPMRCPPSGLTMQCADNWLRSFMPTVINSEEFSNTIMFVTWDEAKPYNGPNKVLLIEVSPFSKHGFLENTTTYSHYSVLATIEHIYSLGNLGRNDSTANVTSDMFVGNVIPSG